MEVFRHNGFDFAEAPGEDGGLVLTAVPSTRGAAALGVADVQVSQGRTRTCLWVCMHDTRQVARCMGTVGTISSTCLSTYLSR